MQLTDDEALAINAFLQSLPPNESEFVMPRTMADAAETPDEAAQQHLAELRSTRFLRGVEFQPTPSA